MRIRIKKRPKKEIKKANHWPAAYRWAAMGTLMAYSATGSKTFNVARAQDAARPNADKPSLVQTQDSQPVRRFEIPAGPLDSVLEAFRQVTGMAVTVGSSSLPFASK